MPCLCVLSVGQQAPPVLCAPFPPPPTTQTLWLDVCAHPGKQEVGAFAEGSEHMQKPRPTAGLGESSLLKKEHLALP